MAQTGFERLRELGAYYWKPALIMLGGQLLEQSAEFQELLATLKR